MAEETARARIGGVLRRNGRGVATELIVNFALPYVVYDLAKPRLGDAHALMASSAPPIIWAIVEFIRRRRVDFISMFVLAGIALSLLAMAGGGSVKFLQLRERLVTAAIGLAFVMSALIRRPLIYEFARASMRRNQSDQLAEFEAHRNEARIPAGDDDHDPRLGIRPAGRSSGGGPPRPEADDQAVPDRKPDHRLFRHGSPDRVDLPLCARPSSARRGEAQGRGGQDGGSSSPRRSPRRASELTALAMPPLRQLIRRSSRLTLIRSG